MAKNTRRRFGRKPLLEALEDRTLLSTAAVQQLLNKGIIGPTVGTGTNSGTGYLLGPETNATVGTARPGAILAATPGKSTTPADFKGPAGYAPFQLQHAYGYDQLTFDGINTNYNNAGAGQTIAIVDAYDDPDISTDLQFFDNYFGITGASGNSNDLSFFTKVNQNGGSSLPSPNSSWGLEISLDVEWAHAMAPSAKILLVEANSSAFSDLDTAVEWAAAAPGVSEVSMSFAGGESAGELALDSTFTQVPGHQGVSFVAATGDHASPGGYPAASPNVMGAGGTSLVLDSNDNILSETGWDDSGGGISPFEPQPAYQNGVVSAWSTTQRTSPDLSYNADPNTGVSVRDTFGLGGWVQVGGTSASTPQLSATLAIVNQDRAILGLPTLNTPGSNQTLTELYNLYRTSPGDFNDITSGNNGYPATTGYDLVTGLGTPVANQFVPGLASINTTLEVTSATPAPNSFVTSPPTDYTITFSQAYDPSTVAASELTVDGIPADSVIQVNSQTLEFQFDTSPVTAQGPQTLAMVGGQLKRLSDGKALADYTETFYYSTDPLNVASVSPTSGSVVVLPTDVIVHFNEPLDASTVGTSNIKVSEGTVTGATLINSTTVDYTISGTEPDGSTLTVSMAPDSLLDSFENPGPQTGFSATYQVNVPVSAFPTLTQLGVPGGLIYTGTDVGNIGFTGDTHTYTLQLDAGQTLSAYVTSDPSLQATIAIEDPNGHVIGSASASSPGSLVALSSLKVSTAGTYSIIVGGAGATTGNITLTVDLNTALQKEQYLGGDIDSTLASAEALSFQSLVNGATRSAIVGKIPLGTFSGDAVVSIRGVGIELISGSTGAVVATFNDPSLSSGAINDVELGVNGDIFVGVDAASPGNDGAGGEIVHFSAAGAFLGVINLPSESSTGFQYYPFGFDVAPDGSFWVAGPNSGSIIHADSTGHLIATYVVGGQPEWTAVRSDGDVYYSDDATGNIDLLNPSTGNATVFASDPFFAPLGVTVVPSGGIVVADPNYGVLKYDASGNLIQGIEDFNEPIDAQVDSSGNILTASAFGTVDKLSPSGTLLFSTPVAGTPIGIAVVGTDDPAPPTPQTVDYYSFTLKAGQVASVELTTLQGSGASLALVGADGATLALGTVIDGNDQAINEFVAPAAGTYFVQVNGNGIQYDVIVQKGAVLDNYANTSLSSAQLLVPDSTGSATAVGDATAPVASLYAIEWEDASVQLIHSVDPQTGAFLSTFNSPATTLTNPYGFNLATDGSFLYFNDGASFGDNTIYKINPATDQVVSSFKVTDAPPLFGLAYLNGFLYGTDGYNIYTINPSNGAIVNSFAPGLDGNVTGIAGDPSRGVLWGVSQFHTLFEINPTTQTVIASAPDGLSNFEQDIGYQNNEIFVSETNGTTSDIAVFDPTTFALKRDMPVTAAVLSGLGADGVTQQASYYRIDAKAGNTLTISTTTPYGDATQPYQPYNTLQPVIQLYDASGNLLSSNSTGGTITYTAGTTGAYYIQVSGANSTSGEYTLTVKGATGALPAFTVADTNPPAGAYVPPLSSITVDFSDSILLTSLPTAKVTFGGKVATGYTVDNDHEVTWYLQSLPGGLNVPYTFKIAAGAVEDIHGVSLSAFTETIIINTVPPKVVSTSIVNGAVLKPGSITYKVTFNEPINTADFSFSSFNLFGIYRDTDYGATSYSFNAADTVLTITYSNLPDDAYTLTLYSAGIQDRTGYHLDGLGDGVPGSGDYVVNFDLNAAKVAFPTLSALAPLGSLIYQGSTTDVIAPAGESDTYTIKLAKNQTITVDLTTDNNLQGAVAVYDPQGNLIDSFTASGVGGEVVLQTDPAVTSGTYQIVVSGFNATQGLYTVQLTLNAALELADHGGGSDNTIGTAQSIDSSFLNIGGTAFRGAVLGQNNELSVSVGDVFVSARFGDAVSLVHNGAVVATFTDPSLDAGVIQDIKIGPDGDIYVGIDTDPGEGNGGEILKFTPFGTLVATVNLPPDSPNGYYYPFGFDIAADGTIWVAAPNSGSIIHAAANGSLIQQYDVGGLPEWVAVQSSTGKVFYSDDDSGNVDVLDPVAGTTTLFASDPFGLPFGLRFTPAGNLLVADPNAGVLEYDPNGNLLVEAFDFGAIEAQVDPNGNILVANADFDTLDELDPYGNFLGDTFINGAPIGLAVEGVDGTPPPPPAPSYYSFKLDAGQTATVVLTPVSGSGAISEALLNGNGNVLANGVDVDTNIGETLSYTASAAGTYYVAVTGTQVEYSLVVTKNAAFDTEVNDTQALAQDLPSGNVALGAINSATDADWYNFAANAGDKLKVTVTLPVSSALSPNVELVDANGNIVAEGSTAFNYTVPKGASGVYSLEINGVSDTIGEYILRVQGSTGGNIGQTVVGSPPFAPPTFLGFSPSSNALTSNILLGLASSGKSGVPVVANGNAVTTSSNNPATSALIESGGHQASDAVFTSLGEGSTANVASSATYTGNWDDALTDVLQSGSRGQTNSIAK